MGEIIKIAKAYLSDTTSNNQNLNMLTIRDLSKTNDLYLVYLLANMFKNKYYSENENLVRLVKTLGQLVFSRYNELKSDVKNDILVEWVDDKKIYFVAETKNTGKGIQDGVDLDKLHQEEQQKIACAKKHFAVFDGVKYQVVERLHELFHQ